jgi:peptidoglycan/LPS O-acetylase OafA/YrhL
MRWRYRPSLDGLRALAMYLIVLFHVGLTGTDGAFISVNLFFVLSGFLVTNVIMNEIDETGSLRLGRFFARRVRRLLPAAVVAIVGISMVFLLVAELTRRLPLLWDARAALLYFANWRFIAQANDYFAPAIEQSPFLHFWTLSIEEQFYVLFPLLTLLVCKFFGRRLLIAVLGLALVASVYAQYYWAGVDANHAYYGTDARAYQLLIGCLLALLLRRWPAPLGRRGSALVAVSGMATFLVLCTSLVDVSRPTRGVLGTVACAMIIGGLMIVEDQPLGRILSWRVPVWLGTLSYATYLYHWPIILVLERVMTVQPWTMAAIAAVLATALAALSAEIVELPIRRSGLLDKWNWRVTISGVTVSALVGAFLVPAVLTSQRVPVVNTAAGDAALVAVKGAEPLPKHVNWKKIARDKGKMYNCPDDPDDCIVRRDDGPTVLVIGDSQSRMLSKMFTKMARKHDWTLAMNVVPRCMWQENLTAGKGTESRQRQCDAARVGWYDDVLPQLDPDLVILAQFARNVHIKLIQRDGRHRKPRRAIVQASRHTVKDILRTGARVALVRNMVVPRSFDPGACLTSGKKAARCAVPLSAARSAYDGYYETLAAKWDRVETVDLNHRALCPGAPVCQAVVHKRIVWRDSHHFTASYAKSRHRQAYRQFKRSGILRGLD